MTSASPASDLKSAATIYANAFKTDPVVQSFLTYTPENATAYYQHFLHKLQKRTLLPGWVIYVAISPSTPSSPSTIDGLAIYERLGSTPTALSWQSETWSNYLTRLYTTFYTSFIRYFRPDPVFNAATYDLIHSLSADSLDVYPDRWHLHGLVVDPEKQRRGIGRRLLEWGIQKGREEGVPVALEASPGGAALYKKVGFEVVGRIPVMEGLEIPVMLWRGEEEGKR